VLSTSTQEVSLSNTRDNGFIYITLRAKLKRK